MFRFILMEYEMNEQNFVLMHKEAVFQVLAKPTINSALTMMKFNKVVKTRRPPTEDSTPDTYEQGYVQPSTSQEPAAKVKKMKKGKNVKKSDTSKSKDNLPDVIMSNMVDVAVQTVDDPDELEHEEEYNRIHAQSMWQHYCVTTIKKEDFEFVSD